MMFYAIVEVGGVVRGLRYGGSVRIEKNGWKERKNRDWVEGEEGLADAVERMMEAEVISSCAPTCGMGFHDGDS